MGRLLLDRLLQALLVVILVVTTSFVVIRLAPGDPFAQQMEAEGAGAEQRERLKQAFGFDRPIAEQYLRFVANAARGEFGFSTSRNTEVREVLARALPPTLLLMGLALSIGLLGGIALGAWQGWRPDRLAARLTDRLGLVAVSIPEFVLALLLLLGPALALRWFPVNGARSLVPPAEPLPALFDRLHHLVLPALSLALVLTAVVARHQRAAMDEVRDAPFVRAARARGVAESTLLWRHALRSALVPVLTLAGVILPSLVGGAVLVERVFAWPGMGSVLVDAVTARDYHLVVGAVLVGSVAVVSGTLVADLALLWADPRQRRT
ncbi:MAG: ABC transporter permease [Gemmatimonadaceae bacterium]|nr:ABC transporter permease [Gemmatimonadaceae bacterium]